MFVVSALFCLSHTQENSVVRNCFSEDWDEVAHHHSENFFYTSRPSSVVGPGRTARPKFDAATSKIETKFVFQTVSKAEAASGACFACKKLKFGTRESISAKIWSRKLKFLCRK
jgi:hypothetical protein